MSGRVDFVCLLPSFATVNGILRFVYWNCVFFTIIPATTESPPVRVLNDDVTQCFNWWSPVFQ